MGRGPSEVRDPFIGVILDQRYRIDERIAVGGFGAVYRGTHVKTDYPVALKVLHPALAADERVVARFRREGATLTELRNVHTVATYELVEDADGTLFMVMEQLKGRTLAEVFEAEGALPWRRVVAIARAVCDSLAEAHALGVVHRDLKPANIHLGDGDDDLVKVLDFGIAKLLRGSGIKDPGADLTNANEVVGTFDYVSPEQIAGEAYTGASDIYTLGVVAYEMITGVRPFGRAAGAALLAMIVTSTAPPPSSVLAGLPPELDRVLLRCLEREPAARYADVGELAAALDELLASRDDNVTRNLTIGADLAVHDEPTTVLDRARPPDPPPYAVKTALAPPPPRPPPSPVALGTVPPPIPSPSLDTVPMARVAVKRPPTLPPPLPRQASEPPESNMPTLEGWRPPARELPARELPVHELPMRELPARDRVRSLQVADPTVRDRPVRDRPAPDRPLSWAPHGRPEPKPISFVQLGPAPETPREQLIRRLTWVVVLLLAVVLGAALAALV